MVRYNIYIKVMQIEYKVALLCHNNKGSPSVTSFNPIIKPNSIT